MVNANQSLVVCMVCDNNLNVQTLLVKIKIDFFLHLHDLPSQETIIGKFLNDMTIDPSLRNWHCQAKANNFQLLWMEHKMSKYDWFESWSFSSDPKCIA